MDSVSIKFFIDGELVRQDYNDYVSTHNTGQKIMMNMAANLGKLGR